MKPTHLYKKISQFYVSPYVVGLLLVFSLSTAVTAVRANETDTKETGLFGGSAKGFTGLSIYTATGYQHATGKTTNLRVQGTCNLPESAAPHLARRLNRVRFKLAV